jgi:hypothetical protein
MQFIFAFGISFLLPVLLMLLNRAGIVTRAQLVAARRYVIVGITALAAVITPPDVLSQLMLAIPLMILFEGTLIVMRFAEKRDAEERLPSKGTGPKSPFKSEVSCARQCFHAPISAQRKGDVDADHRGPSGQEDHVVGKARAERATAKGKPGACRRARWQSQAA